MGSMRHWVCSSVQVASERFCLLKVGVVEVRVGESGTAQVCFLRRSLAEIGSRWGRRLLDWHHAEQTLQEPRCPGLPLSDCRLD